MMQRQVKPESVPGIFGTLAAGFDMTAKHLWLTLIPIVLDSFLWLGPRLSLRQLIEQVLSLWPQEAGVVDLSQALLELAPRTNLFTSLSVPLVGVPAYMAGVSPVDTPLATAVVELTGPGVILALFTALSLSGLLLSAVYLVAVGRAVAGDRPGGPRPRPWRGVLQVWGQLVLLLIMFVLAMMLIYLPLALLGGLLSLINGTLALLVLMTGLVLALWLILGGYFSPQGIVLEGRRAWQAVWRSVLFLRRYGPTALGLIVTVMLVSTVLDQLLFVLDDGSWLRLVVIAAHAFVSTALVGALFIFYRDRNHGPLAPRSVTEE